MKKTILGAPTDDLISTPHVERYNLTQRHIVGRTRRLCLAFSKTKRGHEAAISLGVFAYNFVREHGALGRGVTPAMAAGIAERPWTIAELVEAALAERPSDQPEPVLLTMPTERAGRPVGAVRELPNGRGFLRVVGGPAPKAKGAPVVPPSPPEPGSAAPVVAPVPELSAEPTGQLDLLSWRPRPSAPQAPPAPLPSSKRLPPGQLSLFGIDLDPEPPKR